MKLSKVKVPSILKFLNHFYLIRLSGTKKQPGTFGWSFHQTKSTKGASLGIAFALEYPQAFSKVSLLSWFLGVLRVP